MLDNWRQVKPILAQKFSNLQAILKKMICLGPTGQGIMLHGQIQGSWVAFEIRQEGKTKLSLFLWRGIFVHVQNELSCWEILSKNKSEANIDERIENFETFFLFWGF